MTQMKKMKMKWNKNKKLLRPEQGVAMKESDGYIEMKDVPATQKVPDAFFPQGSWYKLIHGKVTPRSPKLHRIITETKNTMLCNYLCCLPSCVCLRSVSLSFLKVRLKK